MKALRGNLVLVAVLAALLLAPLVDAPVSMALHGMAVGGMDRLLALLCSWPFYVALFIAPLFWRQGERRHAYVKSLAVVIFAYLSTFVLKDLFHVLRPFMVFGWIPLEPFRDFGFPSGHAATAFALVPLAKAYGSRGQWAAWLAFAVSVTVSRVALGMHFPSDVLAGALLGMAIGHVAIGWERMLHAWRGSAPEALRQSVHVAFGLMIVILVRSSLLSPVVLLVVAIGGGLVAFLQKRQRLPLLQRFIAIFERPDDASSFPGRGIFFYLLGSYFALVLFPPDIAFASILVLAFGDGFASLLGKGLGSSAVSYNRHKTWEGTVGGILFATVAAGYFLPWWIALTASISAMLLETLPLRVGKRPLDDNLFLPFAAGTVIVLISPLLPWVSA